MAQHINGNDPVTVTKMSEQFTVTPGGETICMGKMNCVLFHNISPEVPISPIAGLSDIPIDLAHYLSFRFVPLCPAGISPINDGGEKEGAIPES